MHGMHTYQGLSVGVFGIIWLVGAYSQPGFPNRGSSKAGWASIGGLMVFISQLAVQFDSLATATSVDLFSFLGCVLGLIGVFRMLYLRFPQKS
jgi:hypothetical protein